MDDFKNQLQAMLLRNTNHSPEQQISSINENETIQIASGSSEKEVVLYQTDDGNVNVSVFYYNETFWLTQKAMGELFGVDRTVITKHLSNIFLSEELDKDSVCAIFAHTAADGKNYKTQYYNLDAIIAVGYRVNSIKATRFRQWATATLKEYMIKGFVLNDDMLKNILNNKNPLTATNNQRTYIVPKNNATSTTVLYHSEHHLVKDGVIFIRNFT